MFHTGFQNKRIFWTFMSSMHKTGNSFPFLAPISIFPKRIFQLGNKVRKLLRIQEMILGNEKKKVGKEFSFYAYNMYKYIPTTQYATIFHFCVRIVARIESKISYQNPFVFTAFQKQSTNSCFLGKFDESPPLPWFQH